MYNIILVDDDKASRYLLKRSKLWDEYGFTISDEAIDGYDALGKISSSHFDMAFTDIKMPRIDGIEFLKELREQDNDLCVVFMSGYSDFDYARQGIVLGAFDYILKPVEDTNLCQVLSRVRPYLDKRKEEQTLQGKLFQLLDKNPNKSYYAREMCAAVDKLHLDHEDSVIRRVCEYILLHCEEKISLETVSFKFGFNRCYFGRRFKEKTGEGFIEYVTKVKMERAKFLLQTGKYMNYEVSNMLGYGKADYFCCLFKKHTGVTPTEYKQSTYPKRKGE